MPPHRPAATWGCLGVPEQDVYEVLADVRGRYPIDEDRIYLTGNGGGGTVWLALTRPAAVAALCPPAPPETQLNASAAGFGLLTVTADGGRTLLVCSGLTCWTGADVARGEAGYPPIAEGRYDRSWRLPPADEGKLRDSGAVKIHVAEPNAARKERSR